ncbi:MAG: methyltransferase domain-containing protein [Nocardioidaceae bacterium]
MLTHRRVSAATLYAAALDGCHCTVAGLPGGPFVLPSSSWAGAASESDHAVLDRCVGPTLDIGCGAGRMAHALAGRGVWALGIDVVPDAVRRARARGATALVRNVFESCPAEGRWHSALLADGNIGIGGDPIRLLRRARQLLAPGGRLVVDLSPPGNGLSIGTVSLRVDGASSAPFQWATVSPEALNEVAVAAALRIIRMNRHRTRWFAELTPTERCHT